MLNQVVEDWFAEGLGCNYAELHVTRKQCIPLLHCDCDFLNPSRLGDVVTFELAVTHIGNSSFRLRFNAHCGDEERLRVNFSMVYANTGPPFESTPIPEDIRRRMEEFLEA
jgi:4-hydroxybenzoyl-CoA thioesterase